MIFYKDAIEVRLLICHGNSWFILKLLFNIQNLFSFLTENMLPLSELYEYIANNNKVMFVWSHVVGQSRLILRTLFYNILCFNLPAMHCINRNMSSTYWRPKYGQEQCCGQVVLLCAGKCAETTVRKLVIIIESSTLQSKRIAHNNSRNTLLYALLRLINNFTRFENIYKLSLYIILFIISRTYIVYSKYYTEKYRTIKTQRIFILTYKYTEKINPQSEYNLITVTLFNGRLYL